MEIIAPNRDVIFSNASGLGKKESRSISKAQKKEARSVKRAENKQERQIKRDVNKVIREGKRAERKEKREKEGGFLKRFFTKIKAKRNARKLKTKVNQNNEKVYVDEIPPVINNQKQLPDGTKETVPPSDQMKVGNTVVDKKDTNDVTKLVEEAGKVLGEVPLDKVVVDVNEETGEEEAYKESDIESDGLSNKALITIGVVGLVLVGTIAYFVARKK